MAKVQDFITTNTVVLVSLRMHLEGLNKNYSMKENLKKFWFPSLY